MSDNNENEFFKEEPFKKVPGEKKSDPYKKEYTKESLVPDIIEQPYSTDSNFALERIKRRFHKVNGKVKILIDWQLFEKMATVGMKPKDISHRLGISYSTLYQNCKKEFGFSPQEVIDNLSGDLKNQLMFTIWNEALKEKNWKAMEHLSIHQLKNHQKLMKVDEEENDNDEPIAIEFAPRIMGMKGEASHDDIRSLLKEFINEPTNVKTAEDYENEDSSPE